MMRLGKVRWGADFFRQDLARLGEVRRGLARFGILLAG
jgi:hypothetical protein